MMSNQRFTWGRGRSRADRTRSAGPGIASVPTVQEPGRGPLESRENPDMDLDDRTPLYLAASSHRGTISSNSRAGSSRPGTADRHGEWALAAGLVRLCALQLRTWCRISRRLPGGEQLHPHRRKTARPRHAPRLRQQPLDYADLLWRARKSVSLR